jgi:hypothetical protein
VPQISGSGTTALLLRLAGAAEAMLLTPMIGEAQVALENARAPRHLWHRKRADHPLQNNYFRSANTKLNEIAYTLT